MNTRARAIAALVLGGIAAVCASGSALVAQQTDSAAGRQGVEVTGVVYDSVASIPLAGAVVQLVPAGAYTRGRATTSDSTGHFQFPDVAPGQYLVGFFDDSIEALGIGLPARPLNVAAGTHPFVTLAIPSAPRIESAICGAQPAADSTGLLLGHLRDADTDAPVDSGTVLVHWSEIVISAKGVSRTVPKRVATSDATGLFAMCGVPILSDVLLQGARGGDSTGVLTAQLGATRLLQRDLFVASRQGTTQLRGVVRRADSGAPLAGARVSIEGVDGVAVSDDSSRFALAHVTGGSRMLLARAVGFLPDRRPVELVAAHSPQVEIRLSTIRSVLDTIHVVAQRVYQSDAEGFEQRRKSGFGHFFAFNDIAKLQPVETTDLLERMPGLSTRPDPSGFGRQLVMSTRGAACAPDIVIDGIREPNLDAEDVNLWVQPDGIRGLEIYDSNTGVPLEYASMSGCGAILIWTQRTVRPPQPPKR